MGFKRIGVNKFLNERAILGTEYHSIAEQYLTGMVYTNSQNPLILNNQEYKDLIYKLQVLQKSFDSYGIQVVNTEMQLHGKRYGGTLDLLCRHNNGNFLLFDFKSSKAVHDSHLIQLAGYSMLLEELFQINVAKVGVILLSKSPQDKKFMNFISRDENRKNEEIFNKLLDIYWIQQEYQ